jgi:hypothetical protein
MLRPIVITGALAALAGAGTAAAQTPAPQTDTLTVIETAGGGRTDVVDRPPRSPRGGEHRRLSKDDTLVITNPLRDTSGRRIGRLRATCAVTKAGGFDSAAGDCLGAFALKAGRIYVTVPMNLAARTTHGTVLGGTGAYAGVRGTWTSVQRRDGSARDTFTLTRS